MFTTKSIIRFSLQMLSPTILLDQIRDQQGELSYLWNEKWRLTEEVHSLKEKVKAMELEVKVTKEYADEQLKESQELSKENMDLCAALQTVSKYNEKRLQKSLDIFVMHDKKLFQPLLKQTVDAHEYYNKVMTYFDSLKEKIEQVVKQVFDMSRDVDQWKAKHDSAMAKRHECELENRTLTIKLNKVVIENAALQAKITQLEDESEGAKLRDENAQLRVACAALQEKLQQELRQKSERKAEKQKQKLQKLFDENAETEVVIENKEWSSEFVIQIHDQDSLLEEAF